VSPLVVIVGETASGKSRLAHSLALKLGGEIISADSWAVYKGFNIGTAKPSARERAEVAYHGLDIADPAVGFSAVEFQRLAQAAIEDISSRGKLPIIVGGTGLYIDSILYDYSFLPATDANLRSELDALSLEGVLQRAEELGLDTTDIDLRNKRRVIRLIENNGIRPSRQKLRENTIVLGLQLPREDLEMRMAKRIDAMLAAGLEDEVRRLADRYSWEAEPMKGIGYREFKLYFDGQQTLTEVRERIIRSTVQLAKKQRTWFKRNKSIHWLSNRDIFTESVDFITTNLHT